MNIYEEDEDENKEERGRHFSNSKLDYPLQSL
jgi:hypothetical protein